MLAWGCSPSGSGPLPGPSAPWGGPARHALEWAEGEGEEVGTAGAAAGMGTRISRLALWSVCVGERC